MHMSHLPQIWLMTQRQCQFTFVPPITCLNQEKHRKGDFLFHFFFFPVLRSEGKVIFKKW
jgi:hypothetical protein